MFKHHCPIIIAATALFAIAAGAQATQDAGDKGRALAQALEQRDRGYANSRAEMTMTIANAAGNTTVRELTVELLEVIDGGDLSIMTFEFPADVKGTALLSHPKSQGDDEQWLFLPAINRVKRISSRNKTGAFVGSEFSFEDLADKEVDDFAYQHLGTQDCSIDMADATRATGDSPVCHRLERVSKTANTGYSKQILTIDPDEMRIVTIEYYDVRGNLFKRLTSEKFKLFAGKYWRPLKVTMLNVQTKKSTTLEYKSLSFDVGLSAHDFNRAGLGR